jgi:hypothetical protein
MSCVSLNGIPSTTLGSFSTSGHSARATSRDAHGDRDGHHGNWHVVSLATVFNAKVALFVAPASKTTNKR